MFTADTPIPRKHYGNLSPFHVSVHGDEQITISINIAPHALRRLETLFKTGKLPPKIPPCWTHVDQYLDVPVLRWIVDGSWQAKGDEVLWLRRANLDTIAPPRVVWAAERGHLKTMRWTLERVPGWQNNQSIANAAASHGQINILQWIRCNGGCWSTDAADLAARHGQLATLQWIVAHGGNWSQNAVKWASKNQHLPTLEWLCDREPFVLDGM